MNVCLSFIIPINLIAIPSSIAIAVGLYFFFFGFRLLAQKRLLLSTPTSEVRSAAMGLVEVGGTAVGPYTMPAPITGHRCFLYRATAWRQRNGNKREWEKVADETLHVPFLIDDSTGQMLIEPFGAELDLHPDFEEVFEQPFVSAGLENIPACVSAFLSRHGIASGSRLRIEEISIKPDDPLFVAGTLTKNPGIEVHSLAPPAYARTPIASEGRTDEHVDLKRNGLRYDASRHDAAAEISEHVAAPQVIRLAAGASASGSQYMGQQAKIAAALTRAGITKPEAWSAAGTPSSGMSLGGSLPASVATHVEAPSSESIRAVRIHPDPLASLGFNLKPPAVLMKGANNPTFVISFRSQKEFVSRLAWRSAGMICGGTALALFGFYLLLT